MTIKASELRKNLFKLLDRCLETGEMIEVPRKGEVIRISAANYRIKIADLPRRPGSVVDSNSLDTFSPAEWKP